MKPKQFNYDPNLNEVAGAIAADNRELVRECLGSSLEDTTDCAVVWVLQAWTCDTMQGMETALRQALEIDPGNETALAGLSWIHGIQEVAEIQLEAKQWVEDAARRETEETARIKQEEERQQAEAEVKAQAEKQARLEAEEAARIKQAEERQQAQAEVKAQAEEQARLAAEEAARIKQEEERQQAETEVKAQAEEQSRLAAEEAARIKQEEERKQAETEVKAQAEEQSRLAAEEAARIKQDEERKQAEVAAKAQAEEQARLAAEEAARIKQEAARIKQEEERKQAEAGANARAEEQARLAAEEAARIKQEEERKQAEAEAKARAEEQTRLAAEEAARIKHEEEQVCQAAELDSQENTYQEMDCVESLELPSNDTFNYTVESQASENSLDPIAVELKDSFESLANEVRQEVEIIESDIEENDAPFETADAAKPVILAVDDSPTIRKLVSLALTKQGYTVITAEDGIEALNVIRDCLPDLILSDINMPKLGGYQLCKYVKKTDRTKDIPVIMLSGKDGVFDKMRGKLNGCNAFLAKPFESKDLIEIVCKNLNVTKS